MRRKAFRFGLTIMAAAFGSGAILLGQYSQPQYPPYQQQQPAPYQQQPANGEVGAQDVAGDQQHGVARLSIVQGDVNVKRANSGDLVAAVVNAPLMTGDHLQTSPGSRAEVQLDAANLVRLAPNTDLGFADLEYGRYQVQLGAGAIQYRMLNDQSAQVEIDTPSIAAKPLQTGEYRIAVLDDGTTQITVRSGDLQIYSPRGAEQIGGGKTVLVRGDPSDPEFLAVAEIPRDQFDDWCANRDRTLLASQSYQYVDPDINGAQDLDAYGNWVPSQYGNVWAPQQQYAGWSPYSDGQWTWEGYYGWTWVDADPWGWAPYHYGRWFWNGGYGWCWWPGMRGARAYWSPALVGFFGWGGFGVGFGGGIGWVALAPFEALHPWWGLGFNHGFYGRGWNDYGMWRNVDVARMYRNAAIRGGAMTVGYDRFGHAGARFAPANMTQLRQANLFHGAMPVSHTRASLQFSNRRAVANPRLAAAAGRHFYTHEQPRSVAGTRQSYGGFQRSSGSYAARGGYSATGRTSGGGWQRFGAPGAGNSLRPNFLGGQDGGWHQFGAPGHSSAGAQSNYRGGQSGYQARPQENRGTGSYHYVAPAAPRYRAPSSQRGGGGGYAPRGGGGGGGGHASSGGGHGRGR
jgi:hypothetical protein